jgi:hypothetical protein
MFFWVILPFQTENEVNFMGNEKQINQYYRDSSNENPRSTAAVISLIAGILGLTFMPFIGSVVALITGSMAKNEIAESGGDLSGEEMARVGIILGWIGVGLTTLGICVFGVMILIPLCGIAFGLSTGEWWGLIPVLVSFI